MKIKLENGRQNLENLAAIVELDIATVNELEKVARDASILAGRQFEAREVFEMAMNCGIDAIKDGIEQAMTQRRQALKSAEKFQGVGNVH